MVSINQLTQSNLAKTKILTNFYIGLKVPVQLPSKDTLTVVITCPDPQKQNLIVCRAIPFQSQNVCTSTSLSQLKTITIDFFFITFQNNMISKGMWK